MAAARRILIVRLGAMGDILHTLPAVAALRAGYPQSRIGWLVEPQWQALLHGNPWVDDVLTLNRKSAGAILDSARRVHGWGATMAVDFQGLIKSALAARVSGAACRWGLSADAAREPLAARLYTNTIAPGAAHIVDRHLELARAAGGVPQTPAPFALPPGRAEGTLPDDAFVLACPLAGWASKQWPLDRYAELARLIRERLQMTLVLNGPPFSAAQLSAVPGTVFHASSVEGLIDATRRAAAVVGVDSGPMHLGAALGKPGVAIFGPTDPKRNGPYGTTFETLRAGSATTTYKRLAQPDPAMLTISPSEVVDALCRSLERFPSSSRGSSR